MSFPFGLALLASPLMLVGPVLLVIALVDLLRRPEAEFRAAGQDRLVWAVVVVVVGFIGPIVYLLIGRPKLNAVAYGDYSPPSPHAPQAPREGSDVRN